MKQGSWMNKQNSWKFFLFPLLLLIGACSDDKSASLQRVCSLTAADGTVITEACSESQFLVQPAETTAYTLTCKIPTGLKQPEGVQSSSSTLQTAALKSSKVVHQAEDAELPSLSWDCNSHFCPQTVAQPTGDNQFCDVVTQNIQIAVGASGSTAVSGTRTETTIIRETTTELIAAETAAAQAQAEAARAEAAAVAEQTAAAREVAAAARAAADAAQAQADAIREAGIRNEGAIIVAANIARGCPGTGQIRRGDSCVCDDANGYVTIGSICAQGIPIEDAKFEFMTKTYDYSGTDESITLILAPTAQFSGQGVVRCSMHGSFEQNTHDVLYLHQRDKVSCNGTLVEGYHKFFKIRMDSARNDNSGWYLGGFGFHSKTASADWHPIYINPCIDRWVEYSQPWSSVRLSVNDTAVCINIRTYDRDNAGTDDYVFFKFPRAGGAFPDSASQSIDNPWVSQTNSEGVIALDHTPADDFERDDLESFGYTFFNMDPFKGPIYQYKISKPGDDSWGPDYWNIWVFQPGQPDFLDPALSACRYDHGYNVREGSWSDAIWIGSDDTTENLPTVGYNILATFGTGAFPYCHKLRTIHNYNQLGGVLQW
ncbi:MAG: hypothetical protein Q7S98_05260 [Deltaproteobacteria bacterium]|nr:hypothetical protein [Deltaproteobacteria bacterium]